MSASLGLDAAGRGPEVASGADRPAEARRAGKTGLPDPARDIAPDFAAAWVTLFEAQPDAVLALAAAELARRQVDRQEDQDLPASCISYLECRYGGGRCRWCGRPREEHS